MIKENYVRPAILADSLELAPKIRIGDRKEIMASDGATPLEALVLPFTDEKAKIYTIVGTESEGVIGMFGSSPTKLNPTPSSLVISLENSTSVLNLSFNILS